MHSRLIPPRRVDVKDYDTQRSYAGTKGEKEELTAEAQSTQSFYILKLPLRALCASVVNIFFR
jgi:hypothetical protein